MADFVQMHVACPVPGCGSSDGRSINADGSWKCFSCDTFHPSTGAKAASTERRVKDGLLKNGRYGSLVKRGIHEDTCRKWGYQIGKLNGDEVQIANYRSPDGIITGQKIRGADKQFTVRGHLSGLYGQHLWKSGGKRLIVVEGELDALSVSQAFANKWPVASVPTGAAGAKRAVSEALEWLEGFDAVVFMFDMDEAGRKAMAECAMLLSPGRAKLAELPLKDANEMLKAKRSKELVQATWDARDFRPDGILGADELWARMTEERDSDSRPYPYAFLNDKTHGLRTGELVTVCAGSGIGKSLLCREIAYNLLMKGEKVGYIALEESVRRTGLGILGIHLSRPLHLETTLDVAALEEPFRESVGNGSFFTYDHWGSCDSDNLLAKIRYLCKGMECRWIFLDHLSIVVSGFDGDDERRLIDNTMTRLRSLVEETNCGMIVVSHLKRPTGVGHEEGAVTSLAHLRGSQAIAQLSDIVIGMERNQQAEEDVYQTRIRILKNRFSGDTGMAGTVHFDPDTGRFNEIEQPF